MVFRKKIRSPITLHQPKNLDTASALALLQEEEVEAARRKPSGKSEYRDCTKPGRGFSATEKQKSTNKHDESLVLDKSEANEKWAAVKAYRRANNLCYTCGKKWTGRNHKCSEKVSLHMIQELMEMFQLEGCPDSDDDLDASSDEVIMVVAQDQSDTPSKKKRRTIRFRGFIGKQEILILLDLGSVNTFVSSAMVSSLKLQTEPCEQLQFIIS